MKRDGDGLDGLPLETRLLRYHEMREEAERLAETAGNDARRNEYRTIAENWALLAQETERALKELRRPGAST